MKNPWSKNGIALYPPQYPIVGQNRIFNALHMFKRGFSSEDELRKTIVSFLAENCICTLATCANNVPRSTPVRYRSNELTIYILAEGA